VEGGFVELDEAVVVEDWRADDETDDELVVDVERLVGAVVDDAVGVDKVVGDDTEIDEDEDDVELLEEVEEFVVVVVFELVLEDEVVVVDGVKAITETVSEFAFDT
jgi:hypothetical protein